MSLNPFSSALKTTAEEQIASALIKSRRQRNLQVLSSIFAGISQSASSGADYYKDKVELCKASLENDIAIGKISVQKTTVTENPPAPAGSTSQTQIVTETVKTNYNDASLTHQDVVDNWNNVNKCEIASFVCDILKNFSDIAAILVAPSEAELEFTLGLSVGTKPELEYTAISAAVTPSVANATQSSLQSTSSNNSLSIPLLSVSSVSTDIPTNLQVTVNTSTKILSLTWDKINHAIGYKIFKNDSILIHTIDSNTCSITLSYSGFALNDRISVASILTAHQDSSNSLPYPITSLL